VPGLVRRYMTWLHTGWPAGTVEALPDVKEDGTTAVPGVRVVGDLTGIPLLKFSSDSGARAVQAILAEPGFASARRGGEPGTVDIGIIGAGVSGIAAAMEAKKAGLTFAVFEATEVFSTLVNIPERKPIYTYPTGMTPAGGLQLKADVKEDLLEELEGYRRAAGIQVTLARIDRIERRGSLLLLHHGDQETVTKARRAIVAIGRSGSHRKLGVPGEELPKAFNRLYDPKDFAGQQVLVVGGGDSALETSIALEAAGAHVTLSYRRKDFVRPMPENIEKIRLLEKNPAALALGTRVVRVEPKQVWLEDESGRETSLPNDVVFTMLGREAPLDFFRRSGIPIRGEWNAATWASFILFFVFCVFLYNWKAGGTLSQSFEKRNLFPYNVPGALQSLGGSIAVSSKDPKTLLGTLAISWKDPGFYYSLAYCMAVLVFGVRRVRRRRTPYVKLQTVTLTLIQWIPLFLLPFVILPYLGHNGAFDGGIGRTIGDNLFPAAGYGHGREYWRAYGLILAWPLFIWNIFTSKPMAWWLVICLLQTFVIIPLIVRRWGKGAYCGWICSCGALAETLGDAHRQKMPHGPFWNRMNMLGQAVLAAAMLLFAGRVVSWSWPGTAAGRAAEKLYSGVLSGWSLFGIELNYSHVVDMFLAGIVGLGMYFWFSGRIWCRFACPLAALMHIYARFSRFRIFPEKSRCISCNVCTSVCHQGIDVMSFANKGLPMEDPECVRCSACVQMCPTGTLQFGRYGSEGLPVLDRLPASPVLQSEAKRA
jgi:NosR/NirI family nitrous oxide reductase transcriptional regulator